MSTPGSYITNVPPVHPRQAGLTDLVFQPGIASNAPGRDLQGRYKASNRVRWHKGLAEKIGGWKVTGLSGANGGIYVGTVRGACDWSSLDTQQWIAFGTECKLYLVNNNTLYDITPSRKTSNTMAPFTTTNASAIVLVTDFDHRANVGDHITIANAVAVGGLTLDGDYDVDSVIDDNNYTITAASAATSGAAGGGNPSINYDIYCGLAENGELYGYGTATYGVGTWGTPRAPGTGIPAKMRTWSLQNWGQDLVASYSDGEIYWWQRSSGPNTPAALLVNAPTSVQRILVNADREFLVAIGASDVTGNADGMNVRWCSEGILTDWLPVILPVANSAGGQRLNFGSTMITGIQSRGQNLLWSDTQLYQMQFIGTPNYFGFTELGKCSIVGPNAVIDVNGSAYFMGYDDFFIYDGTLRPIPCDMWETVYGDFDRTQAQAVYVSSNRTKAEVQWLYPSSLTPGQMNYVCLNIEDGCWYGGIMPRTAYQDVSAAISGYFETPYAFNAGYLYQHEVGLDEVEASGTVAMDWFLETWDIGAQSDRALLINSIVPDFQRLAKGMQFRYRQKNFPTEPFVDVGPFIVTPTTTKLDARAAGTQIAIRFEAARVASIAGGAPVIDGTPATNASWTGSASDTVTVSTSAASSALIVIVGNEEPSRLYTVASMTSPGLTFTRYTGITSAVAGAHTNLEVWYAPLSGALVNALVTVTLTGVIDDATICAFGVKGLHSAIFDAGTGLPAATFMNGAPMVVSGLGTTEANDLLVYLCGTAIDFTGSDPVGWASNVTIINAGGTLWSALTLSTLAPGVIESALTVTSPMGAPNPAVMLVFALRGLTASGGIVYGQDFRMGTWQSLATPYGKRRGESSMGDPIDTSGP